MRGDAKYVQVIHTSKSFGTTKRAGDVDIYVRYKPEAFFSGHSEKHTLSLYIHLASCTKRLVMLAEENGNGTMIANVGQRIRGPKPNECVVGVYGTLIESQQNKKYKISLDENSARFFTALEDVGRCQCTLDI